MMHFSSFRRRLACAGRGVRRFLFVTARWFADAAKHLIWLLPVIAFWLLVWHIVAWCVGSEIIIVSPRAAFARLFVLAQTREFWLAVLTSLRRISLGFVLAMGAGAAMAVLAAASRVFSRLVTPAVGVVNAMPLASFVLLVLFLFGRENLSVVVPFVMVLPLVYHNVHKGIIGTDSALLEMARVFRVPFGRQVRHIYMKSIAPHLLTAVSVGIGFAWKSGISAELIGVARGTIGGYLHRAQVNIQTADMYAWTIAIVALSLLIDKGFAMVMRVARKGGAA
ncbi:MAG: ABC transporter permease subunit [Defluviitaleaceae bacterium]|nr:ABC transporter permease subunit [Defluviitaleaceae bacterium]